MSICDSNDRDHEMKSNISVFVKQPWTKQPASFSSTVPFGLPLGEEGCHYHESSRTHSAFGALDYHESSRTLLRNEVLFRDHGVSSFLGAVLLGLPPEN